jgi:DNA-binding transcriptional regulator GbsR (MarR family)
MSRAGGATLDEMRKATGWQPHSVRGLLSGKIKKMPGVNLTAEKASDGPRRYYVTAA